ncbi:MULTISPECIES: succinate dehydrogenase cytochrome b556 subunit [unclassified Photobacterium]|uniref:succinate dehydrogenase cytochrome b556 subunit n=1 Tax=unclassified Photobacterium TaxID=2628852 RepID=UPI000D17050B|nr:MULTISPECIES: succinate dehydrogenase cytochrome b556 subunit [unclassified Photobacterium]PSV28855.1 succinate dehydrogenase cytochrome b556 large subunit [Photobacterium sp. GB-56]PSV33295.1 succinate dehydrogenase cytochrome b556 large subunit [Photobacterium sp. GB-72]PSV39444.1 succinate dehydrogenase cytochrome b556 large subunit [Photobacterium sp. GB-27]PSV40746.1 succinate dehydrogenase cytochrome b556 large subunit [Photobacterium sp. GB-210]PSV46453.1 succinate dehydrogenase cyto
MELSGQTVKVKKPRPVNLDLQTIRFPLTAIASILHRVSGVITFVSLAILLWLLNLSLSSPEGFTSAVSVTDSFFVKFILWGVLTALFYHIVLGVRHLLMDLGYFEEMDTGIASTKVSFAIVAVLAVFAGGLVW